MKDGSGYPMQYWREHGVTSVYLDRGLSNQRAVFEKQ